MANSKNTIQNIPLEGELCMNSLKTEVKPFAGYNEKNTTFYGGTLSPIYDKTTELFDKDNSYTVFNSKGVPYTITKQWDYMYGGWYFRLFKNNEKISSMGGRFFSETERLNVPEDTILATVCPDKTLLYITSEQGLIVKDGVPIDSNRNGDRVITSRVWFHNNHIIVVNIGELYTKVFYIDENNHDIARETSNVSPNSFISGGEFHIDDNNYGFRISIIDGDNFIGETGVMKGEVYENNLRSVEISIHYSDSSILIGSGDYVYVENFYDDSDPFKFRFDMIEEINYKLRLEGATEEQRVYGVNLQQYGWRLLTTGRDNTTKSLYVSLNNLDFKRVGYTGNNGYDVGCPIGGYRNKQETIYYQNGSLISIGCCGLPIDACASYGSNVVKRVSIGSDVFISYCKNDMNWYCYSCHELSSDTPTPPELLKQFVLDGRYIIFKVNHGAAQIYDIETDEIRPETRLDWIISQPPCVSNISISIPISDIPTTGCVFGGGVNAGYMINNSPFVGYLPNPFVLEDFPDPDFDDGFLAMKKDTCVQNYCSVGDTVQSAKYLGNDLQYFNTVYPIDPNGNVVLPISSNVQLIKGYSNNDLVKEGNMVYPLMYYNNNQKTYTYMLLSGMENVTNAFSLQGQQYTVDDENIYAVSFNAGVIQNATAVAYKKNLTFLGTLPTQAVFWSDFNKTFYAFTGDRILSRMFEASDINKIEYVGQNPATLSLWICTDDGIYVLSDKDMFKLDYNSKQVAFYSKNALIVTEGATNNEVHAISLYLNDNEQGEMIPVKLQTAYYGLGSEQKAVMDCWYLRLFDKDRTEGYVKVKVNTITDVTRHTEEKTFNISPSDYDDNNIVYIRYQPKYQECVSMQLELETNLGIYSMALGVNTTDSTTQVSKFNF